MWRRTDGDVEVLLAHPGGPFFAKKDAGAWTIPKGIAEEGEDLLGAAHREFCEETGMEIAGECLPLGEVKGSGKKIVAFAYEGDFNPTSLKSNTFEIEWPPRSGKKQLFPEIDRAQWFPLSIAHERLTAHQTFFLTALEEKLKVRI